MQNDSGLRVTIGFILTIFCLYLIFKWMER